MHPIDNVIGYVGVTNTKKYLRWETLKDITDMCGEHCNCLKSALK